MTRRTPKSRRVVPVVAGSLLVVLVVALPLLHCLHTRHVAGLFAGPSVDSGETARTGFYALPVYKLEAYQTGTEEDNAAARPGLLDRSAEDERFERIEGIHPDYKLDVTSGATRAARMKEPTSHRDPWVPRFLTITYPPDNALFPPNLCAPFVEWNDIHNNLWQVTVSIPHAQLEWKSLTAERRWRVPDTVWARIKEHAAAGAASVQVRGIRRSGLWGKAAPTVHRSQRVTFRIARDPADNIIVYRLVDPPFANRKTPSLFIRDIRLTRPTVFLDARQQYCVNCHAFSSKKGTHGRLSLQVRYVGDEPADHAVYAAVYDIDRHEGRKTIFPFDVQMSTFMAWSPDETRLAVAARQRFAPRTGPVIFETQTIGQDSDIAVYNALDGTGALLPGASEPKVLETYPRWTPDGKSIVYSSAPVGKHPSITQLDLYIIPFRDGLGGSPAPVPGASANGKSNFYARFSPDGKWMSWVQADYASLIKASSDIYLMSADFRSGPRALASNVPHAADSWHSWSSNSRWILFATKREDGIFARLYMTHIDEAGNASPAVRLPIETPRMRMSFNIPEFLAERPPIEEHRLFEGMCIRAESFKVKPPAAEANGTASE